MTARKSPRSEAATKTLKPATANEADPQSWLYLNPAGPSAGGLVFGVLRKSYAGRTNSALEFGWRKAHVENGHAGSDVRQWSPNVERVEVILPASADDMLADPAVLFAQMDAGAAECEKALLVYLTLPLGDVGRVHVGWERARAFAGRIARERELVATHASRARPGQCPVPAPRALPDRSSPDHRPRTPPRPLRRKADPRWRPADRRSDVGRACGVVAMTAPSPDRTADLIDLAGRIMLTHTIDPCHLMNLLGIAKLEAEAIIRTGETSVVVGDD